MIYFKLNDILDKKEITKYSLSKMTGIDNNTIAKICNNESKQIKLETIEKICVALNITPNDLLEVSPIEVSIVRNDLSNVKIPYYDYNSDIHLNKSNNIISGYDALKNAEQFEKQHGYNPIPTDEEYYEIEQIQERLDLEYTLEDNLETIINIIISKSDLSSLPIRISKEIEAYSQQNVTSFQFKFILAYRSLYALIVKQFNNKQLIDFISQIIKIYNNGGLYEISNDDLESLIDQSNILLNIYKKD